MSRSASTPDPSPSKRPRRGDASDAQRNALLDAAESVVLRDGIGRLTLDAVAKEAGASKGGLLHHYPNKELLIDALVRRKIDGWRRDTAEGFEREPAGPGRAARAILNTCLASSADWNDAMRRSSVVLVAALVHDPKHVEPLREAQREMLARFERDALPAGAGEAIHLAVNGLWFDFIFGLSEWSPQRLAAVRSALETLLAAAAAPAARGAAGRSRTRSSASKRTPHA
jgi:AcrR family transcriptional regulator